MNTIPALLALGANLAAPSIFIGFLIGFGGVGGVLLAPALSVIGGIPIHDAIRLCMPIYVVSGMIGTLVFVRNGHIRGSILFALSIGACPGALAGALGLNLVSAVQLEMLIAVIIFLSGLHTLSRVRSNGDSSVVMSSATFVFIGALTGFGSALTGTGGPLILIPILLFARVEAKQAIGLAQAIQIPIGLLATVGNMLTGSVDFLLGSLLAVAVALGVLVGANLAHRSSNSQLQMFLGVALILIAIAYGTRSAHALWQLHFG